jgi:hypothetical protein
VTGSGDTRSVQLVERDGTPVGSVIIPGTPQVVRVAKQLYVPVPVAPGGLPVLYRRATVVDGYGLVLTSIGRPTDVDG